LGRKRQLYYRVLSIFYRLKPYDNVLGILTDMPFSLVYEFAFYCVLTPVNRIGGLYFKISCPTGFTLFNNDAFE